MKKIKIRTELKDQTKISIIKSYKFKDIKFKDDLKVSILTL